MGNCHGHCLSSPPFISGDTQCKSFINSSKKSKRKNKSYLEMRREKMLHHVKIQTQRASLRDGLQVVDRKTSTGLWWPPEMSHLTCAGDQTWALCSHITGGRQLSLILVAFGGSQKARRAVRICCLHDIGHTSTCLLSLFSPTCMHADIPCHGNGLQPSPSTSHDN